MRTLARRWPCLILLVLFVAIVLFSSNTTKQCYTKQELIKHMELAATEGVKLVSLTSTKALEQLRKTTRQHEQPLNVLVVLLFFSLQLSLDSFCSRS